MAASDERFFQDALQRKYNVLQQQADAGSQDAASRAQSVAQQPGLQQLQNQGAANVAGIHGEYGLRQTALSGQNAANVAGIQGGFGLQERAMAVKGAADVANIQGGYGLRESETRGQYGVQEAQVRGQYGLEAAKQPEYSAIENPLYTGKPGQSPYISTPRNQAGMEYLNSQKPTPPALPGGLSARSTSSPAARTSDQAGGYGLSDPKRRASATSGASGGW